MKITAFRKVVDTEDYRARIRVPWTATTEEETMGYLIVPKRGTHCVWMGPSLDSPAFVHVMNVHDALEIVFDLIGDSTARWLEEVAMGL